MTMVEGKGDTTAGCCPHLVDGEEPLIVLTVSQGRDAFQVRLTGEAAFQLGESLTADSIAIRPAVRVYRAETAPES